MNLLTLLIVLGFPAIMQAGVISAATRLDATGPNATFILTSSANNFSPHTQIWYNYSFSYRNVPAYLKGADSLRTLFQDNEDTDYQLRLTLNAPATLFLLVDDRIDDVATAMPWLAPLGFTETGDFADYLYSNSYVRTLSIYSASFPAGDVVLLPQDSQHNHPLADGSIAPGMYVIGASASVPEPASSWLLLLGPAGFLYLRRQKPRAV